MKRTDNTAVSDGFVFDGNETVTTKRTVTSVVPDADATVDLGSPLKKFKNIYYDSITPDPSDACLRLDGSNMMTSTLHVGANCVNLQNNGDPVTPAALSINVYEAGDKLKFVTSDAKQHVVADSTDLDSYLPLAGGSMVGNITMSHNEIKDCSAYRISTLNQKTVIGSSTTSAGSDYCTVVGGVSTTDGTSISSTVVGYGNSASTSGSATIVGSASDCKVGSTGACVIGYNSHASSAIDSVVVGSGSTSSAQQAHCIGSGITNPTASSTLFDSTVNIRSTSPCDLGTTSAPFGSLYASGVDNAGALSVGTTNATSLSIGRATKTTTVNGFFQTALPKAAWYTTTNLLPNFTANTFQNLGFTVGTSTGLVDFTIDNATGNLTYTGTQTRTFVFTCNMNLSFTNTGTFMLVVNKNAVSGLQNGQVGAIWDVTVTGGSRQQLHISDQVVLNTNDVLMLCARWTNTSATQVTCGRTCFQIFALPN